MPRFVLLEHAGHPDDPAGLHYDLLLEEAAACRTWRLERIPAADGEPVATLELPPHGLGWLERLAGEVSGGRGFARRIDAGTYRAVPDPAGIIVDLAGGLLVGRLRLEPGTGEARRVPGGAGRPPPASGGV